MATNNNGIQKRITESIPAYFFVYDIDQQKITYLTDSSRKFIGEESSKNLESIKGTIHPVYHLAFDSLFAELGSGRLKQNIDLKTSESNDMPRWVNFRTFPISSQKIAGHVTDISEVKKKEDQIQKEADKKEVVLHLLLHDLRSPVTNMREFSKLMQEAVKKGDMEEAGMYAQIIQRLSMESDDIMTRLTEMVEVDTPDFKLKFKHVNLCEIIEQVIENHSIQQMEKELQVNLELPEKPLQLMADETKIRLVFQNLISNAIKFTPLGGQIMLKSSKSISHTIITVKDSGIGIPHDKVEEIFEQFTEMKREGTNGEKSTGLGLSLAKKIVEMHGGKIEVESSPGAGSTFRVRLPLKKEVKVKAGLQK